MIRVSVGRVLAAVVAPLLTTAALLTGCGQGEPAEPSPIRATALSGQAPPDPHVSPPEGFPDAFPDPPDGAPLLHAALTENAIIDQDLVTENGTAVHRTLRYETGSGSDGDVEAVLDYYREALPAAAWAIDGGDKLEAGELGRAHPVSRLMVSGHGHDDLRVNVEQRDDVVHVLVSMTELHLGRTYSANPPLIPLPDWVGGLTDLPGGAIRQSIEVDDSIRKPVTVSISFSLGDPTDLSRNRGLVDVIADHYRGVLPAMGWTIADDQESSEIKQQGDFETDVDGRDLRFVGDGVSGQLGASQVTYPFEDGARPVSAVIVVSLDS